MPLFKAITEIAILSVLFYYVIRSLHGTQGEGIIRGYIALFVLVFAGLLAISKYFSLHNIEYLLTHFLGIYLFAIVIIFQPELRNGFIRLGQASFGRILKMDLKREEHIAAAVRSLAKRKIGALIAIEKDVKLGDCIRTGIRLDAQIGRELLSTIFWPGSPLHDGGVIIQNNLIVAASCIFPLSEQSLPYYLGTRHRAALGLSETTDAMILIVSEERGEISLCFQGNMEQGVSPDSLEKLLYNHLHKDKLASTTEAI